jgi:hypothetical protein
MPFIFGHQIRTCWGNIRNNIYRTLQYITPYMFPQDCKIVYSSDNIYVWDGGCNKNIKLFGIQYEFILYLFRVLCMSHINVP